MSRMIVYTCPTTGRDVPSGVLTDDDSFAQLPHERVTVKCTECGDLSKGPVRAELFAHAAMKGGQERRGTQWRSS
jgi:hypothetical protein